MTLVNWTFSGEKECSLKIDKYGTLVFINGKDESIFSWENLRKEEKEKIPAEFVNEEKTLIAVPKKRGQGDRLISGGLPRDLLKADCPTISIEELIAKLAALNEELKKKLNVITEESSAT